MSNTRGHVHDRDVVQSPSREGGLQIASTSESSAQDDRQDANAYHSSQRRGTGQGSLPDPNADLDLDPNPDLDPDPDLMVHPESMSGGCSHGPGCQSCKTTGDAPPVILGWTRSAAESHAHHDSVFTFEESLVSQPWPEDLLALPELQHSSQLAAAAARGWRLQALQIARGGLRRPAHDDC